MEATGEPGDGLLSFNAPPEAKLTEGVSIDDCETWRATRFSAPEETG